MPQESYEIISNSSLLAFVLINHTHKYKYLRFYYFTTHSSIHSSNKYFYASAFYLFIFTEGKGGRKRGRETSMCGCLSHVPHRGPSQQPSMCAEWESNQQLFGSQASTQSTDPHQPGLYHRLLMVKIYKSKYQQWRIY